MHVVAKTDIGHKRDENQDRVKFCALADNVTMAVLCDGMGGQNAGSEASELAVNIIYERIVAGYRPDSDFNSIRNLLISAVCAANAVIFDVAEKDSRKVGMGTTCVAVLTDKNMAHFVNVGDSRAYILGKDSIIQVTSDHTVVRFLYEQGQINENEIKSHPQRNYITKAVGVSLKVEPDYFEVELEPAARVLLCSDGLSNYCSDEEISKIVQYSDLNQAADRLIQLALANGGSDNITLALIGD